MTHNMAGMHAYAHQLSEVRLEFHPDASAAELLDYLGQQARKAQLAAAEVDVAREGMTMDQALAMSARKHEYRAKMRREMAADS